MIKMVAMVECDSCKKQAPVEMKRDKLIGVMEWNLPKGWTSSKNGKKNACPECVVKRMGNVQKNEENEAKEEKAEPPKFVRKFDGKHEQYNKYSKPEAGNERK